MTKIKCGICGKDATHIKIYIYSLDKNGVLDWNLDPRLDFPLCDDHVTYHLCPIDKYVESNPDHVAYLALLYNSPLKEDLCDA